jgi:type VI secretion system secreted protein Hcp
MAVDMFLKLAGIPGDSADKVGSLPGDIKHTGEIDVLAWSWGVSQSGSTQFGGGGGSGKANVQDISITKRIDKATPNLLQYCLTGKHVKDATLTMRKAGTKPVEYLVINLEDIIISGLTTGGSSGGDLLTENVTLNFAKVKLSFTEQDTKGDPGKTILTGFDIAGNVVT